MIDWLIQNKEWLFSGIGVVVLASLFALFQRKAAPVVVRVEQSAKAMPQPDISGGTAIPVERISPVTRSDISATIESAPLLQRPAVAARYIGQRIEWDTELCNAHNENDGVKLQLRAIHLPNARESKSVFVWCYVKLNDYRELAILPASTHIRVSGIIEDIDVMQSSDSVTLKDAKLTFLSSKNGT